jgi:hypothetical protein
VVAMAQRFAVPKLHKHRVAVSVVVG